ncbi:hypothetical protein GALL_467630 [mine drainage metagenome]|uniref:Uncharacterized protein n=1 Tax=mine drainage metagenome TaxID=410659 RepID=A0A1J5PLD0_9ZZZZ
MGRPRRCRPAIVPDDPGRRRPAWSSDGDASRARRRIPRVDGVVGRQHLLVQPHRSQLCRLPPRAGGRPDACRPRRPAVRTRRHRAPVRRVLRVHGRRPLLLLRIGRAGAPVRRGRLAQRADRRRDRPATRVPGVHGKEVPGSSHRAQPGGPRGGARRVARLPHGPENHDHADPGDLPRLGRAAVVARDGLHPRRARPARRPARALRGRGRRRRTGARGRILAADPSGR